MKIIDLLNKIANGEEVPKKIKYQWIYEYKFDDLRNGYSYINESDNSRFDNDWLIINLLNDEIEIIEEDKPIEKIIYTSQFADAEHLELINKVNELIDEVNKLKKESDK